MELDILCAVILMAAFLALFTAFLAFRALLGIYIRLGAKAGRKTAITLYNFLKDM